jgi:hypothetical protein
VGTSARVRVSPRAGRRVASPSDAVNACPSADGNCASVCETQCLRLIAIRTCPAGSTATDATCVACVINDDCPDQSTVCRDGACVPCIAGGDVCDPSAALRRAAAISAAAIPSPSSATRARDSAVTTREVRTGASRSARSHTLREGRPSTSLPGFARCVGGWLLKRQASPPVHSACRS